MGDGSSNLGKLQNLENLQKPQKPYLEKGIEDLSFIDQITHLGKSFTKEEKKQFFDELSEGKSKKYKIGLLRSRELDNVITIFTESFDFSKKLKKNIAGTNSFDDRKCTEDTITFTPIDKLKGDEQILSTLESKNEDKFDYYNQTSKIKNTPIATREEINTALEQTGGADTKDPFDLEEKPLIELDTPPQDEEILTSSDFERKYLGWMNNPELDMPDEDKQKRRNILKSLFRFIFGKKTINQATATTYQKKYRIAYTTLTNEEKLPCKESDLLWEDFKKSLEYRRALAMCEMFAARDLISEKPIYVQLKKELVFGLRDMINVLDQSNYVCMQYGYDPSQHELEGKLSEEEYSRILKVFKTFVQQRKKPSSKPYTHAELKEELGKKVGVSEKSILLYNQLLELLVWTTGTSGESESNLKREIDELKRVSKEKNVDISELEHLVILLSTIIVMSEKIFTLRYTIQQLDCKLKMCEEKKRLTAEVLSDELKKQIEKYKEMIKSLQEDNTAQSEEIKELEDTIIELSKFIVSIEKVFEVQKSIERLQGMKNMCDKYKGRLQNIGDSLNGSKTSDNIFKRAKDLEDTVIELSRFIIAHEKTDEIAKDVSKMQGQLEMCEVYKRKLKAIMDRIKSSGSQDCDKDIKELEDIITELNRVIISIERVYNLQKSVSKIQELLLACHQYKKRFETIDKDLDTGSETPENIIKRAKKLEDTIIELSRFIIAHEKTDELAKDMSKIKGQLEMCERYKEKLQALISRMENSGSPEEVSASKKELKDTIAELNKFIISLEESINIQKDVSRMEGELSMCQQYKQKLHAIKIALESGEKTPQNIGALAILNTALGTLDRIESQLKSNETVVSASKKLGLLSPSETPAAETPAPETPAAETPAAETPAAETPSPAPAPETPSPAPAPAPAPAPETGLNLMKDPPIGVRKPHNQKGGSNNTIYDTILALLLLKAKNEKSIDIPKFMKKMDSMINALGGRSDILTTSFNDIIDKYIVQNVKEDGYVFSSVSTEAPEFSSKLEELYDQEFTTDEKEVFTDMFPCIVYHSKVPEEFQEILGTQSYFLNGCFDTKEDVRLYGLEYDDVVLTPEEREKVSKGGIPLGALVILFLSSKQSSDSF